MGLKDDKAKWVRMNEQNADIVSIWTIPGKIYLLFCSLTQQKQKKTEVLALRI